MNSDNKLDYNCNPLIMITQWLYFCSQTPLFTNARLTCISAPKR